VKGRGQGDGVKGLRVLITNNTLRDRSGSELYVRDVALGLLARGHTPISYSGALGAVADDLRRSTVPVVQDLDSLGAPPDLIHGHHHVETMSALLRFPDVPAVFFCHGWMPWEETPPRHPRILRYVAVDDTCRDRLICENGIAEDRVRVLLNFVDLDRFLPRACLPPAPARALVFSNYASEDSSLPAIRQACDRAGIALDAVGAVVGNVWARPEESLGHYDLVFAKARSALEAMATGAAVILCGGTRSGPLVTSAEFDRLRRLNFGIRALQDSVTTDGLLREIRRYDAADAAEVSRRTRATAGRAAVLDQIELLYREVLADHAARPSTDRQAEGRAAAAYLRSVSPVFQQVAQGTLRGDLDRLSAECDRLRQALAGEADARQQAILDRERSRGETARLLAECDGLRRDNEELRTRREGLDREAAGLAGQRDALLRALDDVHREAAGLAGQRDALRHALDDVHRSVTMRLRASIVSRPWLRDPGHLMLGGVRTILRRVRRGTARPRA
jgi:hypothetical protein